MKGSHTMNFDFIIAFLEFNPNRFSVKMIAEESKAFITNPITSKSGLSQSQNFSFYHRLSIS